MEETCGDECVNTFGGHTCKCSDHRFSIDGNRTCVGEGFPSESVRAQMSNSCYVREIDLPILNHDYKPVLVR